MLDASAQNRTDVLKTFSFEELNSVVNTKGIIETVLHVACKNGSLDIIKYLFSKAAEENGYEFHRHLIVHDQNHHTPIHLALIHEKVEILSFLLTKFPSIARKELAYSKIGHPTLLNMACVVNNPIIINLIVDHMEINKLSIDEPNISLQTALHISAAHNKLEVCQILINRGSNALLRDSNYKTASELATEKGNSQVANYLIVVETCIRLANQVVSLKEQSESLNFENMKLKNIILGFSALQCRQNGENVNAGNVAQNFNSPDELLETSQINESRRKKLVKYKKRCLTEMQLNQKNDMNSNNSLTPSQDLKPIRPSPKINNLNFQTSKHEDQDLELELSNNSGSPGEMEYTGTTSTPQGYQELQNQTGQESSSNDSQKVQIKILRHTQAAPVTIHLPTLPSNQKQGTSHKVLIKDKETSYPKSGMVLKTSMSSISPISEDEVINTSGIPKKTKVVSLKELKRRSSKEDILPIHKSTLTSEKCITRAMQDGSSTKLSNSKPPLPEKIKQKYSSEIFNRKLDMVDQTDKSSTPSLNERLSGLPLKFDKILNIDSTVAQCTEWPEKTKVAKIMYIEVLKGFFQLN